MKKFLAVLTLIMASLMGFSSPAFSHEVKKEHVQACSNDPFFAILGDVVMFRSMGASKSDVMSAIPDGWPEDLKKIAKKAIDIVYSKETLPDIEQMYVDCLNSDKVKNIKVM